MRDPAGNAQRYQDIFETARLTEELLAQGAHERTLAVQVNMASDAIFKLPKMLVTHYAAGVPLDALAALAADHLAQLADQTAFLHQQGVQINPAYAQVAPLRTDDRPTIGLMTIALTLLPSAEHSRRIGPLVPADLSMRALLPELLLKAFDPAFSLAKKYPQDKGVLAWSAPVLRALALAPEQRAAALGAHMNNWCRLMRPFGWKPELNTAPGKDKLFTDFAFEVALAVCAFDVDDAAFRAHPYYPSDLVDYYRAHVRDTRDAWRAPYAGAGVAVQAPPLPAKADLAKSKRKGVARWIELACDGDVDATEAVLEAAGNPRKLKDSAAVLEALAGHQHAILADLRDDDSVAQACALLADARGLGQFEAPSAPPAGLTRCEATLDAFGPWLQAKGYRLLDLEPDDDAWALLVVRESVCQEFIDLGATLALPLAPAPR